MLFFSCSCVCLGTKYVEDNNKGGDKFLFILFKSIEVIKLRVDNFFPVADCSKNSKDKKMKEWNLIKCIYV